MENRLLYSKKKKKKFMFCLCREGKIVLCASSQCLAEQPFDLEKPQNVFYLVTAKKGCEAAVRPRPVTPLRET